MRDLEVALMEETRVIHARCNHMQEMVDNHVIQPMHKLERHVERLSSGDHERGSLLQAQDSRIYSATTKLQLHEQQLAELRQATSKLQVHKQQLDELLMQQLDELRQQIKRATSHPGTPPAHSAATSSTACKDDATRTPATIRQDLASKFHSSDGGGQCEADWPPSSTAPTLDLQSSTLERLHDLELRVQDGGFAMSRLQDFIFKSMDGIKGCIDEAISSRRKHNNDIATFSDIGLPDRVISLEAEAKSLAEAIGQIRCEQSILGGEIGSRRVAEIAEARESLDRLDHFESMVSEIQAHVVELGRQLKEAKQAQPQPPCTSESEPLALPQLDTGEEPPSPDLVCWVQADKLLRSVEEVVARQQRELASITRNLSLQCREVACEEKACLQAIGSDGKVHLREIGWEDDKFATPPSQDAGDATSATEDPIEGKPVLSSQDHTPSDSANVSAGFDAAVEASSWAAPSPPSWQPNPSPAESQPWQDSQILPSAARPRADSTLEVESQPWPQPPESIEVPELAAEPAEAAEIAGWPRPAQLGGTADWNNSGWDSTAPQRADDGWAPFETSEAQDNGNVCNEDDRGTRGSA
jgi:hypothetical protein